MAEALVGGFGARTGFSEGFIYSSATLTDCRAGSDGSKPMQIVDLYGAISGRGATRTATMYCGGSSVGLSIGAAGSAADTGWQNSSDWLTSAFAAVQYGYQSLSGSCYFARSSTSGPVGVTGAFGTFTGYIGMYYRFWQVASAPTITSVTPNSDGDQATVVFSAPADNGGTGVTGYRIQRATDAAFTTNVATISAASTSQVVTGLTPGVTYYWRVVARNAVSDAAGILGGSWSSTVMTAQPDPGIGRIYSGGTWVQMDGIIRNVTDTAWVELDGRIRDLANANWVELGS